MTDPLAYFLTWRTYGTWLHGEPRGSVDWQHRAYRTPLLEHSNYRTEQARARMSHPPVALGDRARDLVANVVADHCRIRNWELCESAVRSNHVHVVVGYAGVRPEPMLAQFKTYGTRALRAASLTPPGVPIWAEGGSTRYLWTTAQLETACSYVREGQDAPHSEH
jgi:REP element-mobilizing transposase RayT